MNEELSITAFVPFMKTAPPFILAIFPLNEESEISTVSALIQMAPPYLEAVLSLNSQLSTLIFIPFNCTAPPIGATLSSK